MSSDTQNDGFEVALSPSLEKRVNERLGVEAKVVCAMLDQEYGVPQPDLFKRPQYHKTANGPGGTFLPTNYR